MGGSLTAALFEKLQQDPLVDAFAGSAWGQKKVVAYSSAPQPGFADLDLCTDIEDCEHYLTTILSRVPPCGIPPLLCNVKVLLRFTRVARRRFVEHIAELEDTFDGVTVAAALLTGSGRYNAMVEVVGDDDRQVMRAVLALTDLDGLEEESTLVFRKQDTHSWGTFQR